MAIFAIISVVAILGLLTSAGKKAKEPDISNNGIADDKRRQDDEELITIILPTIQDK